MANDELFRLLGPAIGNPEQTITATGSGSARWFGRNRSFRAHRRIGGAVTGTAPTLDLRIQQSPNGTSGWTTIATFPQATATDVGFVAGAVPRYEVPGGAGTGQTITTTQDYIRADWTAGGTTPSFGDVSVEVQPINEPILLRSGAA